MSCTIAADGSSIPPLLLFPRAKMQSHFLCGSLPGTKACAIKGGWMTAEIFANEYLDHLISHTKCSTEDTILLILDNHASHVSIPAIVKAKKNGIVMLTIPPHTSHRLQPLDVAVYGPFKAYYNKSADDWMAMKPRGNYTHCKYCSNDQACFHKFNDTEKHYVWV